MSATSRPQFQSNPPCSLDLWPVSCLSAIHEYCTQSAACIHFEYEPLMLASKSFLPDRAVFSLGISPSFMVEQHIEVKTGFAPALIRSVGIGNKVVFLLYYEFEISCHVRRMVERRHAQVLSISQRLEVSPKCPCAYLVL